MIARDVSFKIPFVGFRIFEQQVGGGLAGIRTMRFFLQLKFPETREVVFHQAHPISACKGLMLLWLALLEKFIF